MATSRSRSSSNLEPPRRSVELHDTGAGSLESSDAEEYFSDASEGRKEISRPATPASPVPRTRVEKVDDIPSHGQIPGSAAYEQRLQDAVPDEIETISEESQGRPRSATSPDSSHSPGGSSIPRTVVEKVDPSSPSHGDIPGTEAYAKRLADSAPDMVRKAAEPGQPASDPSNDVRPQSWSTTIPETVVTRVDSRPAHGEVEGTEAREMRKEDATPDDLRIEGDVSRSPTLDRSMRLRQSHRRSLQPPSEDHAVRQTDDFGDDFDEFEEGAQAGEDDEFGDFDNTFEPPEDERKVTNVPAPEEPIPSFPLVNFSAISSMPDLIEATKEHLDAMFPNATQELLSSLPGLEPIPADSPIFSSDRSRLLWKQLVTPPPLQPPNWTKSRIRRLFLVSLGVPVDLDEILPPSKQKKLVLPDINLEPSRKSESDKALGSVARLKARAANESTGSVDSTQSGTKSSKRKPKGPPPPPDLDLAAVKRLCATTNEKIDGFTDEELQMHVQELQDMTTKTSELLEYWLKRRDGALKEKEAFEGVIENLVKHARRVRK